MCHLYGGDTGDLELAKETEKKLKPLSLSLIYSVAQLGAEFTTYTSIAKAVSSFPESVNGSLLMPEQRFPVRQVGRALSSLFPINLPLHVPG